MFVDYTLGTLKKSVIGDYITFDHGI